MLPDFFDLRPGPDPFACCCYRIKVVDGVFRRIPTVDGIDDGFLCPLIRSEPYLAVSHGGKGQRLEDDSAHGIWKVRMLQPVQDDRSNGDLASIRFSPRLAVNRIGHQLYILITVSWRCIGSLSST